MILCTQLRTLFLAITFGLFVGPMTHAAQAAATGTRSTPAPNPELEAAFTSCAKSFTGLIEQLNFNHFLQKNTVAFAEWLEQQPETRQILALKASFTAMCKYQQVLTQQVPEQLQPILADVHQINVKAGIIHKLNKQIKAFLTELNDAAKTIPQKEVLTRELQASIQTIITQEALFDFRQQIQVLTNINAQLQQDQPGNTDIEILITKLNQTPDLVKRWLTNVNGYLQRFLDTPHKVATAASLLADTIKQTQYCQSLQSTSLDKCLTVFEQLMGHYKTMITRAIGIPPEVMETLLDCCILPHEEKKTKLQESIAAFYEQLKRVAAPAAIKPTIDNLKKLYEGMIDENEQRIMATIVKALEPDFIGCKELLTNVAQAFTQKQEAHQADADKTLYEHYQEQAIDLQEYRNVLEQFESIYSNIRDKNIQATQTLLAGLHYVSIAYDFCFNLYKADAGTNDPSVQSTSIPSIIQKGLKLAKMLTNYRTELYLLSEKQVKPVIFGQQGEQHFGQFLKNFGQAGSMLEASEDSLMPDPSSFNIGKLLHLAPSTSVHVQALTKALWGQSQQAIQGALGSVSAGKFLMNTIPGLGDGYGIMNQIQQNALEMIGSCLYYNTIRAHYFAGANGQGWIPAQYEPWKRPCLNLIELAARTASGSVKDLIKEVISTNTLETVEQWTLGIITPKIIDTATAIGKHWLLTNDQLRPIIANIIDLQDRDLYLGTWHQAVTVAHPELTAQQARVLHADRELVLHGATGLATFFGSIIGSHTAGVPIAITQEIAGFFLGRELVGKTLDNAKTILEELLANFFGKDGDNDIDELQEKIQSLARALEIEVTEDELQNWAGMLLAGIHGIKVKLLQQDPSITNTNANEATTQLLLEIISQQRKVKHVMVNESGAPIEVNIQCPVQLISCSSAKTLLNAYKADKDPIKLAQELTAAIPQHLIGQLVGALCGLGIRGPAAHHWEQRVVETGRPVLLGPLF